MLNEDKFTEYLQELLHNTPYHREGKNKSAIDFGGVYALFDYKMNVLYIGQSMNIYMKVWRRHKNEDTPWVYARAVIVPDEEERTHFENWCIKKLSPKYNTIKVKKQPSCKHCNNSGYFLKDGQPTRCTHCNWMGQKDEV